MGLLKHIAGSHSPAWGRPLNIGSYLSPEVEHSGWQQTQHSRASTAPGHSAGHSLSPQNISSLFRDRTGRLLLRPLGKHRGHPRVLRGITPRS